VRSLAAPLESYSPRGDGIAPSFLSFAFAYFLLSVSDLPLGAIMHILITHLH
jgi:hypothetical protein